MKYLTFVIVALFFFCSVHGSARNNNWEPVKIHGQLQVKGRFLCNGQGDTISLRGVSLGWHNLWPRFYNKKAVKWLKDDWKCSVIRAAMGAYEGVEDGYLVNPEFALNCVETVVRASIKENVYVIIDWHAHDFLSGTGQTIFCIYGS